MQRYKELPERWADDPPGVDIWYQELVDDGKVVGYRVHHSDGIDRDYCTKHGAKLVRYLDCDGPDIIVDPTDPSLCDWCEREIVKEEVHDV